MVLESNSEKYKFLRFQFGTRSQGYTWWDNVPSFICLELFRDRFVLLFYRVRD